MIQQKAQIPHIVQNKTGGCQTAVGTRVVPKTLGAQLKELAVMILPLMKNAIMLKNVKSHTAV